MAHEKLLPAPKWASIASLAWYLTLWWRGVRCALATFHPPTNGGTLLVI